jgi:hypothetical protein
VDIIHCCTSEGNHARSGAEQGCTEIIDRVWQPGVPRYYDKAFSAFQTLHIKTRNDRWPRQPRCMIDSEHIEGDGLSEIVVSQKGNRTRAGQSCAQPQTGIQVMGVSRGPSPASILAHGMDGQEEFSGRAPALNFYSLGGLCSTVLVAMRPRLRAPKVLVPQKP